MSNIKLNDILKIQNLDNVKIRLLTDTHKFEFNPLKAFNKEDETELCKHQFFNYKPKKFFKEKEITIGVVRIKGDKWLLFHIGKVTKDLNVKDGVGYEYQSLEEYQKYIGRVIIDYHNIAKGAMGLVFNAKEKMDDIIVSKIIEGTFEADLFPGYENICIDWETLNRIKDKPDWQTALENQKGVYLITDRSNGKMYVGSAYGENMILGRWQSYIKNGHGGNEGLKEFEFEYIKKNFQYSILEIFQAKTSDDVILAREAWWKKALLTREFGYNKN